MDLLIHKPKAQNSDVSWIGQRPPVSMPTAGGLVMLTLDKRGFSAPEGIWKLSLSLLCQGTLFHILALAIQSGVLWHRISLSNNRGPFCHLKLCNKILVTEWQILESRRLKYLTRARAFPEITLHGSGQLYLLTPFLGIHRLKTQVSHYHWGFCY